MVSKINLKARIERHSRILKDNLWSIHPFRSFYHRLNYNIVLLLVVFLFPVYPLFSAFVTDSEGDYYRWNVDESSILDAYQETTDMPWIDNLEEESTDTQEQTQDNSYLSVNTIIDSTKRDVSSYNQIIDYEVKPWDSYSSIAYKFGISTNTIYWANNFDSKRLLHPWEKIKIPPVSWVVHKIVSWDTLSSISKKYKIDQDKILSQNWLTIDSNLIAWNNLIIPWAIKEIEKPVIVASTKKTTTTKAKTNSVTKKTTTKLAASVDDDWEYDLVKRKAKWNFYWWNCTRFVAQYKNVDWSWNAKDWLRNAKAKWHATWDTAQVWAIVVFNWGWYNPRYWHVWIVTSISWNNIIIKDMNYRRLNEVTVRKVSQDDWAIIWYIYVD